MEISIFNVCFVTFCLIAVYYLGYIKGYTKGVINANLSIDKSYDKVSTIDDFRNYIEIYLEKGEDGKFLVYERATNKYIGSCSCVTDLQDMLKRYGPPQVYWGTKEMFDESGIK